MKHREEIVEELRMRGYYARVTNSGLVVGGVERIEDDILSRIVGGFFDVTAEGGRYSISILTCQIPVEFTAASPTEVVERIHAELWPHFVRHWHQRIADELKERGWKISDVHEERVSAAGWIDHGEPFSFLRQPIVWVDVTERGWHVSILPLKSQISVDHHNLSFDEALEIIGWNTWGESSEEDP